MYGRPRWDERAQLALLDAMVFFAVSAVICSTLMSCAVSNREHIQNDACRPPDTDKILSVFLSASVGKSFFLDSLDLAITGLEQFAETLFVVSVMIMDGQALDLLESVTSHCSQVLCGLCSPWSPTLRLSAVEDDSWVVLTEIGEPPVPGVDTYSASQDMGASEGADLMVTLVLFPALALHGLCV